MLSFRTRMLVAFVVAIVAVSVPLVGRSVPALAAATPAPTPGQLAPTNTPTPTPTPTPGPTPTVPDHPAPPLAPAGPEVVVPPTPDFPAWIDEFARYESQRQCRTAPQPGIVTLQNLLTATYGLANFSTSRPCNGSSSEHHDGRAIDVMLRATDPGQLATAHAILGWLLGPDKHGNAAAVARRFGVMYVIFDHYIWRSYRPDIGWQPYQGRESHADHIHISLSPAGAAEQTSWWSLDPMTIPGLHLLGTRWWRVNCAVVVEVGSRCSADIKATRVSWNAVTKRYVRAVGWVRNRTTTVATQSPTWDAAPTAHSGDYTSAKGVPMHTTCTAEPPAARVCKTSQLVDVVVRTPESTYAIAQAWALRTVVKLLAPAAPESRPRQAVNRK